MFIHTRVAGTLSSVCSLCGHTIRARADRDVFLGQRLHDPLTCQQRRAENTRPEGGRRHCPNGHDWTPENVYINPQGQGRCRVCDRERKVLRLSQRAAAYQQEKEAS